MLILSSYHEPGTVLGAGDQAIREKAKNVPKVWRLQ